MKAQSRSTADGIICQQPPIMETEEIERKASVLFLAQKKPKTGTEREDHLFLSAAQLASQGCKCPGASAHRLLMGGGGRASFYADAYEATKSSHWDVPGDPVVGNPPASAGDTGSIPGVGRFHMPQRN